jgi:hypothetical protein
LLKLAVDHRRRDNLRTRAYRRKLLNIEGGIGLSGLHTPDASWFHMASSEKELT